MLFVVLPAHLTLLIVDRPWSGGAKSCCFNGFDVPPLPPHLWPGGALQVVVCFVLLFNEYGRDLSLLWLRLDLTRLINVSIPYYPLRLQSPDKYEGERVSRVQSWQYSLGGAYLTYCTNSC